MHGALKAYKEFKKHDIKAVLGQEFYYCDDITDKGEIYHLILIAKNNDGFRDLCNLSSVAFIDGFYKKPRIDKSMLTKIAGNVICTTACVFGKAQQMFLNNEVDESLKEIGDLKSIFKEDFYLEIAQHELPDEEKVATFFREIGEKQGIKVLPATDSHYLKHEDKEIHNIFKQIAYNSVGTDNDDAFPGTGYHIWTIDEMKAKFSEAEISNTLEIADKCKVKFDFHGYHLPSYDVPKDMDSYEYLYKLAQEGLEKKMLHKDVKYIERLEYEMKQLHLTELEDYFLIVMDYINWCKKENIPVGPGRGSGAGSLVSYLIGITSVDPLQYDLLFSRAINPGRSLQYAFFSEDLR